MDQALSSHEGTAYTNNNNTLRQKEYYTVSRKWQNIKLQEKMSYKHTVLLPGRQNKKGEVKVAYCPTTNRLADFFMNPVQGSTFKKMQTKANDEHRRLLETERARTKKVSTKTQT